MANISLLVMSSPSACGNVSSALRLANTVINSKHTLKGVFFYNEGVHNANNLQLNSADEHNNYSAWVDLAERYHCPLLVCVTAATKRGVLSVEDAQDGDKSHFNLSLPFQSVGLGELAQLMRSSDRMIQF